MTYKNNLFNRISNTSLFLSIIFIILFKVIIYIIVNLGILKFNLGGGSDANYYHAYATKVLNNAVNFWPIILRCLYENNLYSREYVSILLFILNLFFIPKIACSLANLKFNSNQKNFFYLYLLCLVYPSLFFYTFDIYRDVFMVFSFLIGCMAVKKMLSTSSIPIFLILFITNLLLGYFLLLLRPYLGYAFIISLMLCNIKFSKKRILILSFLYLIVLYVSYSIGLLDSLVEYRSGFSETSGGSTIGLDFSNPIMFVPNLFLSTLGQLFGLYITNAFAIVLLILETLPIFFMIFYIINNVKFADKFARFLIVFFILYASVWLIGNDNLGTAVRLRFYNYLSIYICFFYIVNYKRQLLKVKIG